jgi:hypothetical protein
VRRSRSALINSAHKYHAIYYHLTGLLTAGETEGKKVPKISSGLSVPVVIGIAAAVTSCSSSPGTSAAASASRSPSAVATASGDPTAVPAGYKRVGGTAQGVSVAIPASWVNANLTNETAQEAASEISLHGVSTSALVQDLEALQKVHGIVAFDTSSIASSPEHFARNINAYCTSSGVTEVGSAGVQTLKKEEVSGLRDEATHISQKDVEIGGVPGAETSYELSSSTGLMYGSQLEVMPKPDKACFVTLSVGSGQSQSDFLAVAAATAQFP